MKILLTGCAGFIGSHVLDRLLAGGHTVLGVDNFDPFYPRSLKQANLAAHLNDDLECARVQRSEWASEQDAPATISTFPPSHLPTFPPPPPATKGSFDLVEGDLADAATYSKIRFIAEGLQRAQGGDPQVSGLSPQPSNTPQVSGLSRQPSKGAAFDAIIHLAAKTGVRPSIGDPVGYQRANVIATQNLLEFAREERIRQFVFASSSSVYGVNPRVPWREDDHVLQPISPYASSKVSCELLGHVYSHLHGIRFLALRFFTVFGPRQRPDLAINKFVRLIEAGEPIPVFGDGSTRRDYTYVGDIVDGILGALYYDKTNFEVVNLGNDQTVTLSEMIATIEEVIGKKAIINRQPEQPGDVPQTWADVSKARQLLNYQPTTTFRDGIVKFYEWWQSSGGGF